MDTTRNRIVLAICAQLHSIPHHSCGQLLVTGLLGDNAERIIILVTGQINNGQAVFRHGLVLAVFVLILDLAVLVAKVDECLTQIGIVLGVNLYSKVLAFAFLDDGILQALNGHVDFHFLGKAAIFLLAIRGLSVAHQIARIRTRQVQILLIICFCSFGQLTAILGVCTLNRHLTGVVLGHINLSIFLKINIADVIIKICAIQLNAARRHAAVIVSFINVILCPLEGAVIYNGFAPFNDAKCVALRTTGNINSTRIKKQLTVATNNNCLSRTSCALEDGVLVNRQRFGTITMKPQQLAANKLASMNLNITFSDIRSPIKHMAPKICNRLVIIITLISSAVNRKIQISIGIIPNSNSITLI